MNVTISRRNFWRVLAWTTGGAFATRLLTACGADSTPTAMPPQSPTLAATIPPTTTTTTQPITTAPPVTTTLAGATAVRSGPVESFPAGFVWGAATSSYQIEGAVKEDGRGESIWDTFSHTGGKVRGGDSGDIAADHYHRYEQDLDLMGRLGLPAYRFSIAWPRILPTGKGAVNQKGLDFYARLVDGLLKRNIQPYATLYHWDLPQSLQDQGGWTNRDTADRFAEYAQVMFKALGDRVGHWITHNEPWVVAYVGHAFGTHAPGLHDWPKAVQTTHYLLLSHGLATQAYRANGFKAGQIGITLNLTQAYPASSSPQDAEAARRIDGFQNRWFLDPLFKGDYPTDMRPYFDKKYGPLSYIQPNDLKIMATPLDFLGVNFYSPSYVRANPLSSYFESDGVSGGHPLTAMGWEVVPTSLYDLLVRLSKDYPNVPIYITENGAAYPDALNGEQVADPQRQAYLHDHLAAARRAIAEGVPLKGYFAWSLLDNFEWAEGYSKRFGLVYVDYPTQKRLPKQSASWYSQVIRQNGL